MSESQEWWADLIVRRNKWREHNFPGDNSYHDSILGVIEELGELTHGFLKRKQGIRGTREEHDAAMQDAIADLSIYMMGVMSTFGPPEPRAYLDTIHKTWDDENLLRWLTYFVGGLAYADIGQGTSRENIPHVMSGVMHALELFTRTQGWDFPKLVEDTWAQVEQRDWIKYPDNGRPPTGGVKPLTGSESTAGFVAE